MDERESASTEGDSAARPPAQVLPPPRRRGGFFGRLLAALLVILITSFVALMAGAVGLLYLGFSPDTPRQLADVRAQLATVQSQSEALQSQNTFLQTEVAVESQRGQGDHELLGDIERQVGGLGDLQRQLRDEREAGISQNATLVAEARSSRDAVTLFATAEAGRSLLLDQLQQRSARVERFLERLSDVAGDAALDLGSAPVPGSAVPATDTAAPPPTPTAAPPPTPSPTSAPTRTAAPTDTPVATATIASTTTRTPRATPSPTAGR